MLIRAEDYHLRSIICSIASIVQKAGGLIHPNVCFTWHKEICSVHCMKAQEPNDHTLLHLPYSVLVPINSLSFESRGDDIYLLSSEIPLSRTQTDLLHLMIDLYNHTK